MRYIRRLADVGRGDLAVAGGKGANLGELTRAGVPVPPGFVLTTAAYRTYVDRSGIGDEILATVARDDAADRIRALFTAPIPEALADELRAARAELGPAVAVRSSATAEDLEDASFAGQQDTFLNVRGDDALLDAVRGCWASLWTARAIAYRARRGIDPAEVALAVVVQEMVDADAAGVLFTANPTTGARDEVVIAAAWGLGEAVVGGSGDHGRHRRREGRRPDPVAHHRGQGRADRRGRAGHGRPAGSGRGPRPPRARRRRGGRPGRARRADRGVVRRAAGRGVGPVGRRVRDRAVPADHGAARGRRPRRRRTGRCPTPRRSTCARASSSNCRTRCRRCSPSWSTGRSPGRCRRCSASCWAAATSSGTVTSRCRRSTATPTTATAAAGWCG